MRVLSPRIEPPDTVEDGSTASTATRWPCPIRYRPSASMKVDLPTPGTPLMPSRKDFPVWGSRPVSSSSASRRWSVRVDSSSVIALAMARRCTGAVPCSKPWRSCSGVTYVFPEPFALSLACPVPVEGSKGRGASTSSARTVSKSSAHGLLDLLQHVLGAGRDRGAGAVDALDACFVEHLVVLAWDDATDKHDDVVGALLFQLGNDGRHQGLVAGSQRGHAHSVHVVFNRLAGALFGGLEERAHVHVKAQVGVGGGHHLGATVVTVLAELGDHHARATTMLVGEFGDFLLELGPAFGRVVSGSVHTGQLLRVGAVAPVNLFQRVGHFAHGGAQSAPRAP